MKVEIIGSVPVKPVLHQFAIVQENVAEEKIIDIQSSGLIGYTINMMLVGKMQVPVRQDYQLRESYNTPLLFRFYKSKINRYKLDFTPEGISFINKFLHQFMHEILLREVLAMRKYGVSEKDVIYRFMDFYGLNELISFEGMKKANYRLRIDKKTPCFNARVVK